MFTLKSGKLRIEVSEPGEEYNRGFRFDRAAFVSDVVYDGMHFAASEPMNLIHPCSMGRGFCNELRFDVSDEAQVGEYFPKFGVGLIRKETEEKYIFHKAYKDVNFFPVEISHDDTRAVFVTHGEECLGYRIRSEKILVAEGNTMTLCTKITNTGSKAVTMEEFCHNFISIDGMAVGSDYSLKSAQIPDQGHGRLVNRRGFSGALRGDGHGFTFCEFTAIDTDTIVEGKDIAPVVPFVWRLSHRGAGAFVEGRDYYVPSKVPVWGVDHMFCPEVVHAFSIGPGETESWKRSWTFGRYSASD